MELKDLQTKVVDKQLAHQFICRYHYSHSCPVIVAAIGQWYGSQLVNCIVFNYCCAREMASQVLEGGSNENVIELARMVSIEPKPKNLETYAISKACDWLKHNMPNIKVVVSYADNSAGHKGYCYQASNFVYYGQSRPTTEHFLDGRRTHEKVFYEKFGTSSVPELKKMLGDRYTTRKSSETKSRYYKIIYQNKRERDEIQKKILVPSLPYPKGDNTRYDMNIQGSFAQYDENVAQEKMEDSKSMQISMELNSIDLF